MTAIDDGGPAFPRPSLEQSGAAAQSNEMCYTERGHDGMSLRDYFAAHATEKDIECAVAGLSAALPEREAFSMGEARYFHADTMLAARKIKGDK